MRRGRLLHRSLFISALVIALGAVFWSGFAIQNALRDVPDFASVKAMHHPSDVWLVDRNGIPLESLRTLDSHRSLDWVSMREISPILKNTLLDVEDRRFFQHHGVDVFALLGNLRALVHDDVRLRGASTITMQLAKSLDVESRDQTEKRNNASRISKKIRQMLRALKIETMWTKEEILEAYLNRVSFRGEVEGLQAASFGLFRKSPDALTAAESAILVALLRSPNASIDQVKARACRISSCAEVTVLVGEVLSRPLSLRRERRLVPVVSQHFIETDADRSVIHTSLDARVQAAAVDLVTEQLLNLKRQNVQDAALLVLETKTGRVVAYVANGGPENSSAVQVDGVLSRRQLGSTIKAFVYGAAFELGVLSTTSLLLDSPENISVGSGQVYQPRNYDYIFRGNVGAAEALGSSLNVPAVRVLDLVGERRVLEKLHALGFENLKDDDQYGPSLALGTVDASLWELAQGYRQLSLFSESSVFSEQTKQQIFESLSIAENRRFTFGVESLLQLPFAVAAKTGTSKDMRDNWCVGFTSEYTVAAWVGNFSGEPMWNVSGITGAAPLWRQTMLMLHRDRLPQDTMLNYARPDRPLAQQTVTRIRYPVADMLVGLDPDIPTRLQKIPLRIDGGGGKNLSYYIGQKRIASADGPVFWKPRKGKHRLELRNEAGKTIDQVQFVVR